MQAEYEARLEAAALRREEGLPVPVEVEKCQDRLECFNADLKADWERWQNNKRQDFRQLLTGMADKNIQHYQKCLASWESIIPLLQDKKEGEEEDEEEEEEDEEEEEVEEEEEEKKKSGAN